MPLWHGMKMYKLTAGTAEEYSALFPADVDLSKARFGFDPDLETSFTRGNLVGLGKTYFQEGAVGRLDLVFQELAHVAQYQLLGGVRMMIRAGTEGLTHVAPITCLPF